MLVWGRGSAPSAARQIRSYACCFPAAASDRKRGAAPERVRKYRQTHPVYRAPWKSVKRMSQSVMARRWLDALALHCAETGVKNVGSSKAGAESSLWHSDPEALVEKPRAGLQAGNFCGRASSLLVDLELHISQEWL